MDTFRTSSDVEAAVEGLREELEVHSIHPSRIGKSALEGADVLLRVYFEDEPDETTLAHIPAQFDDFPIKVIPTGSIHPQ